VEGFNFNPNYLDSLVLAFSRFFFIGESQVKNWLVGTTHKCYVTLGQKNTVKEEKHLKVPFYKLSATNSASYSYFISEYITIFTHGLLYSYIKLYFVCGAFAIC